MSEILSLPEQFGTLNSADTTVFKTGVLEEIDYIVRRIFGTKMCPYKTGATKMVLNISPDADYIVKLPFSGYYWNDEDDGEDAEEIYYDDYYDCDLSDMKHSLWYDYHGAGHIANDYCNLEVDFYNYVAQKTPFLNLFPKTEKVNHNGFTYYTQEKCYTIYEDTNSRISRIAPSASVKNANDDFFDESWIGSIEKMYGEDFTVHFIEWASSTITDLNKSNYGYSEINNRPVIIDWGGYQE